MIKTTIVKFLQTCQETVEFFSRFGFLANLFQAGQHFTYFERLTVPRPKGAKGTM